MMNISMAVMVGGPPCQRVSSMDRFAAGEVGIARAFRPMDWGDVDFLVNLNAGIVSCTVADARKRSTFGANVLNVAHDMQEHLNQHPYLDAWLIKPRDYLNHSLEARKDGRSVAIYSAPVNDNSRWSIGDLQKFDFEEEAKAWTL
jgi:hypothetical protein